MSITFFPGVDPVGFTVLDRAENTEFAFETSRQATPSNASTAGFYFPVDTAAAVEISRLVTPKLLDVYVRDANSGEMLAQSTNGTGLEIGPGEYNVEVVTSEVKIYLHAESAVVVERGDESVTIDFGDETEVTVGVRSYHERPAHTVTVPEDLGAAMEAVSTFGSALKSLTPERSYPTLRGHPPLLKLGSELEIPEELSVPDTGVRIAVPPAWDKLFPVASLAYYLGARVIPTDDEPRLETDTGFEHSLDGPGGFEATVARTLKQVFFFDCITRTEGYYEIALHERELTEPDVDLDFAALYDRPIAEQVEAYLGEEYSVVEPAMPAWKQTADVWPSPDQVKALAHAANDLALIRCPNLPEAADPDPAPKTMVDFYRSAEGGGDGDAAAGPVISPEPTDSLEHVWFGEGYPMGATKGSVEAYRRQFDVEPRDDLGIDVAVVCNDPKMADEQAAIADCYGSSDDREFRVSEYHEMTTGDLRELLETEMDFLHYVGHVEPAGIECIDGLLDVTELEWAGPKAFILNGCQSYVQADALVEKGSLGGVATLSKVGNRSAMEIGQKLARFLNVGYPLYAGLKIATEGSMIGSQYGILGNGSLELVDRKNAPELVDVTRSDDGYTVDYFTFTPGGGSMGANLSMYISDGDLQYLAPGLIDSSELTRTEMAELLSDFDLPIKFGDRVSWTNEVSIEDL